MTVVRARTKNVDFARHYEVLYSGKKWLVPSVNTLKAKTVPAPALEGWKINRHINAAYRAADLAERMTEAAFRSHVRAEVRSDTSALDAGNRAHECAEAYYLGEPMPGYDEATWVKRVLDEVTAEFQVEPVQWNASSGVELGLATVIGDEPQWAGTADLVAHTNAGLLVMDWKSGASGVFSDALLTTAAYCTATHYIHRSGTLVPIPEDIEGALVVWIRPDGWAAHPITADDIAQHRRALAGMKIMWDWMDKHSAVRDPVNSKPLRRRRG